MIDWPGSGAVFALDSDTGKEALLKFIIAANGEGSAAMLLLYHSAQNTIEVTPVFTEWEEKPSNELMG